MTRAHDRCECPRCRRLALKQVVDLIAHVPSDLAYGLVEELVRGAHAPVVHRRTSCRDSSVIDRIKIHAGSRKIGDE